MEEKILFKSGFIPSKMDGTEHIFGIGMPISVLPVSYSYRNFLPDILNQGELSICVTCTISAYLNLNENLENASKKNHQINYMEI